MSNNQYARLYTSLANDIASWLPISAAMQAACDWSEDLLRAEARKGTGVRTPSEMVELFAARVRTLHNGSEFTRGKVARAIIDDVYSPFIAEQCKQACNAYGAMFAYIGIIDRLEEAS